MCKIKLYRYEVDNIDNHYKDSKQNLALSLYFLNRSYNYPAYEGYRFGTQCGFYFQVPV